MEDVSRRTIHGGENYTLPSHMNYGRFVLDKMLHKKQKIALINAVTGEKVTYGEVAQMIVNTASSLIRLGVRGEVVAICSENRFEFLTTAIALWCAGATVTFLNSAYSNDEMLHSMNISKPKLMFLSPGTYNKFYNIMVSAGHVDKFFVFGDTANNNRVAKYSELIRNHVAIASFVCLDVDGEKQIALILYSSGTTGSPKGAKFTNKNLLIAGIQTYCFTSMDLTSLVTVPWSNTIGFILTMDELLSQKTMVFSAGFNEEKYLSFIQRYQVGLLILVPPMVVMLNKSQILKNYDVNSVRWMYCGGAVLDLSTINESKKRFPNLSYIIQGYGMTETTGALTEETETSKKLGSVGRVVMGHKVKIVDIETRNILGPNQAGELCVKGPALFAGYVGKDLSEDLDEDGFFKTGDICYYDEDKFFYIVDRIKELIKYKTGQVAPSEIEAILLQHPDVKDAAVTAKPDAIAGELPTAFVIRKPGTRVTADELIDFVASKVSSWKQLRGGVYFVDSIPKNPSGKILRRVLRETFKKPASKL